MGFGSVGRTNGSGDGVAQEGYRARDGGCVQFSIGEGTLGHNSNVSTSGKVVVCSDSNCSCGRPSSREGLKGRLGKIKVGSTDAHGRGSAGSAGDFVASLRDMNRFIVGVFRAPLVHGHKRDTGCHQLTI